MSARLVITTVHAKVGKVDTTALALLSSTVTIAKNVRKTSPQANINSCRENRLGVLQILRNNITSNIYSCACQWDVSH